MQGCQRLLHAGGPQAQLVVLPLQDKVRLGGTVVLVVVRDMTARFDARIMALLPTSTNY